MLSSKKPVALYIVFCITTVLEAAMQDLGYILSS